MESKSGPNGDVGHGLDKLEEIKADLGAGQRQDLRSFADVLILTRASSSDLRLVRLFEGNDRYAVPVVRGGRKLIQVGKQLVVKFIGFKRILAESFSLSLP